MIRNEIRYDRVFIDLKILTFVVYNFIATFGNPNISNKIISTILLFLIFIKLFLKSMNFEQKKKFTFNNLTQMVLLASFSNLDYTSEKSIDTVVLVQYFTLGLVINSFQAPNSDDNKTSEFEYYFKGRFLFSVSVVLIVQCQAFRMIFGNNLSIGTVLLFSGINLISLVESVSDFYFGKIIVDEEDQNNKKGDINCAVKAIMDNQGCSLRIDKPEFDLSNSNRQCLEQQYLVPPEKYYQQNQKKQQRNSFRLIKSETSNLQHVEDGDCSIGHKNLFEVFPEGVLIINSDMQLVFMNSSLKNLFNQTTKSNTFEDFLQLRNSTQSLEEQEKIRNFFRLLDEHMDQGSNKRKKAQDNLIRNYSDEDDNEQEEQIFSNMKQSLQFQEDETIADILHFLMTSTHKQMPKNQNQNQMLVQGLIELFCEHSSTSRQFSSVQADNKNESSSFRSFKSSHNTQKTLFHVRFVPYVEKNNVYVLCQVRDVTMFNQMKVLKAINQNKQKMLYFVAHEFRTPLKCIMLMLLDSLEQTCNYSARDDREPNSAVHIYQPSQNSIINQGNQGNVHLVKVDRSCIEAALVQAQSLENLVNDLLDMSQIQAAKFKISSVDFDFYELLLEVRNLLSFQAKQKEIDLTVSIEEGTARYIMSDPNRIRQIIINLTANAIKFTPQRGKIQINVKTISLREIQIDIVDNGQGISKENIGKLFKVFGKLEDPLNINLQGVGLGLVISNILAQKLSVLGQANHNEQIRGIEVSSDGEGKGSTFSFVIMNQSDLQQSNPAVVIHPYQQNDIQSPRMSISQVIGSANNYQDSFNGFIEAAEINNAYVPCKCFEILIVDDNQFNINAQKILLKKEQIRIDEALSGEQAIQKVYQFPVCHNGCKNYIIILMDLEMPGMDGLEASHQISQYCLENNIKCHILGFSGHQSDKERKACINAGMIDLIEKPAQAKVIRDQYQKIKDEVFTKVLSKR